MGNLTLNAPLMPPPDGVQSNYVDPEDQTIFIITSNVLCLVFVTVFVALRLYTKVFIARRISLDDCFCVISYLLTITFSALQLTAEANGLGHHVWDIPMKDFPKAYEPFAIGIFVYNALQMFVKLTCLLFYRHIFHPSRNTLLFVNAGIALVSIAYISVFIVAFFQCQPPPSIWHNAINGGHCYQGHVLAYFSGALDVFSDLYILLVPIPTVIALPVGTMHKVRILVVFELGVCACATSIARMGILINNKNSMDFTWNTTRVGIWSYVLVLLVFIWALNHLSILEVDIGLICACLFVLPAFLKHHRKRIPSWLTRLGCTSLNSKGSETKLAEFSRGSLPRSEGVILSSTGSGSLDPEMASRGSTAHAADEDGGG